jgi:hypothetical protein
METTKLTTVDAITDAIGALVEDRLARSWTPVTTTEARREAAKREREEAARFADLYEMRAAQWHELGRRAFRVKSIADAYGSACAIAEKHDRDQARHWRRLAGAR